MSEEEIKSEAPAAAGELAAPEGFEPGIPGAEPQLSREQELEASLAEAQDKYMRTLAEVDNFKKRVARERVEERAYAAQDVLQSLLPIVDGIERALTAAKAAGSETESGPLVQLEKGVELVLKQLEDALRKQGVTPVEAPLGQPYDPNLHQPLLQEPSEGAEDGAILEVLQKGWKMGDRLLRASMVKVAVKP